MKKVEEKPGSNFTSHTLIVRIQSDAMIFFDETDLDCWIILAILSILMACPLR